MTQGTDQSRDQTTTTEIWWVTQQMFSWRKKKMIFLSPIEGERGEIFGLDSVGVTASFGASIILAVRPEFFY